MIKTTNRKKCARIDICDDLTMLDNLSNPYCYSFGSIENNPRYENIHRLQNRIEREYLYKK